MTYIVSFLVLMLGGSIYFNVNLKSSGIACHQDNAEMAEFVQALIRDIGNVREENARLKARHIEAVNRMAVPVEGPITKLP